MICAFQQWCNTFTSSHLQGGNMLVLFFVFYVSSISFSFTCIMSYSLMFLFVLFTVLVYSTNFYIVAMYFNDDALLCFSEMLHMY